MDILADLDDRPRGLVPEDHRRFDDERPDAPVRVIVNIASANAHGVHADAHIRWPEFVFQLDFAKRQLPLLLEHKCLRLHQDHSKTSCLFERPASTLGDSINASGNPPASQVLRGIESPAQHPLGGKQMLAAARKARSPAWKRADVLWPK